MHRNIIAVGSGRDRGAEKYKVQGLESAAQPAVRRGRGSIDQGQSS